MRILVEFHSTGLFFAGGANGLRGWSARDLGPGFANPDDFNGGFVSGLGDLQGELSVETRKDLTEVFEMAFFYRFRKCMVAKFECRCSE